MICPLPFAFRILALLLGTASLAIELEVKCITIDPKTSVRVPGKIRYTDGMTLLAAISAAGGSIWEPQPRLCIVRGAERLGPFTVGEIRRSPKLDPKLLPGDTITEWEPQEKDPPAVRL